MKNSSARCTPFGLKAPVDVFSAQKLSIFSANSSKFSSFTNDSLRPSTYFYQRQADQNVLPERPARIAS